MTNDPLAALPIGRKVTVSKTVSESDVYLFAGITGDFSPNHTDEAYMRKTRYGRRIAHGALAIGLHLPERLSWRDLAVVGVVAALGFSVGLYVAAALLPPGQLRSETEMGVLISLFAAPLALVAAKVLGVGRFSRQA